MATIVGGVRFETYADISGALKDIKKIANTTYKVNISPSVDSRELHQLNKLLDTKQKHLRQTRDVFKGNPIRPTVDLSQLHLLNRELDKTSSKRVSVKVDVDYADNQEKRINQKIHHHVKVSSQDNAKSINSNVSKEIKSIVTTLKSQKTGVVGKSLGSVGNSLLTGVFVNSTKKIGNQFEKGLNESLVDITGSLTLFSNNLGKISGKSLGNSILVLNKKLKQLSDMDINKNDLSFAISSRILDIFASISPSIKQKYNDELLFKGKKSLNNKANDKFINEGKEVKLVEYNKNISLGKEEIKSKASIIAENKKILVEKQEELNIVKTQNDILKKRTPLSIEASKKRISDYNKLKDTGVQDPWITVEEEKKYQQNISKELYSSETKYLKLVAEVVNIKKTINSENFKSVDISKNINNLAKKRQKLINEYSDSKFEKDFTISILNQLGVSNIDKNSLPSIRDGREIGIEGKAHGKYIIDANVLYLDAERYESYKNRNINDHKLIHTLSHELAHSVQFKQGGLEGLAIEQDIRKGFNTAFENVSIKTGEITIDEYTQPFLNNKSVRDMSKGYLSHQRGYEIDAEVSSRRLTKKVYADKLIRESANSKNMIKDLEDISRSLRLKILKDVKSDLIVIANSYDVDISNVDFSKLGNISDNINQQVNQYIVSINKILNKNISLTDKDISRFKLVDSGKYQQQLKYIVSELEQDAINAIKNNIKELSTNSDFSNNKITVKQKENKELSSQLVPLDISFHAKALDAVKVASLSTAKELGKATINITKFSYGIAKAGEDLAFNFIPGGKQMKRITQVGVPLLGAGAVASQVPGLLPLIEGAANVAGSGSQALLAPAIDTIASGVGGAIASSLSALPGSAIVGGAAEASIVAGANAVAGLLPAAAGVAAINAGSKAIEATGEKLNQLTGTSNKASIAGEDLANKFFKLGGQVRDFSKTLEYQKERAKISRMQIPSAKEFKALPQQERIQKASTLARISAHGIVDQKAILGSLSAESRTQGGQIGKARALLAEFSKQHKKAKRILAKEKIDIDDVVDVKNITASVEIISDTFSQAAQKNITKDSGFFNFFGSDNTKLKKNAKKQFILLETVFRQSGAQKLYKAGKEIKDSLTKGLNTKSSMLSYDIKDYFTTVTKNASNTVNKLKRIFDKDIVKHEYKGWLYGDFSHKNSKNKISQLTKEGTKDFDSSLVSLKDYLRMYGAVDRNDYIPKNILQYLPNNKSNKKYNDIIRSANVHADDSNRAFIDATTPSTGKELQDKINKLKSSFNKIWESNSLSNFRHIAGNNIKTILGIIRDLGIKGALNFGALAIAGVAAFKTVSNSISLVSRSIGDLFFNTQKNIEAFSNLFSLSLKFKAAGIKNKDAFDIAQKQGVSVNAIDSQAIITSALRSKVGVETGSEIAERITQGLKSQGIMGEDLSGSLRAISQIASKGKLQQEEKLQLAERGIDINTLSQNALGVSASQLEKMQQSGRVLAVEYLPALVEELEKVGSVSEFPTEELVRAQNNIVKFRATLGKGTLDASRPFLKMFNDIAKQTTLLDGIIKGVVVSFTTLSIVGAASLFKLIASIKLVKISLVKLKGLIDASKLSILGFSASVAGIVAGFALIGVSISSINKSSSSTKAFSEMANKSKSIADSFDDAAKSVEKIGRFGEDLNKSGIAKLFSGDLGSRLINFTSFGGLRRKQENEETISVSEAIAQSNRVFTNSIQSPEKLQESVALIKSIQNKISAKKIELIDLNNAQASREEITAVNREIGDLSTKMLKNKKSITGFIAEFENIEAIKNSSSFSSLSLKDQESYNNLYASFKKFIPLFRQLRDEMNAKMLFDLKFNLDQNSIEAAKLDLNNSLANLDLNIISSSLSGNVNAALEGMGDRKGYLSKELSTTEQAIANQRKELLSLPQELTTQIEAIAGSDLLSLSNKQLLDSLTKLEKSSESVGEDLKAALEKAKQLKANEVDVLQKRKAILELELKIQALSSQRNLAKNNIVALSPLRDIKRENIDSKIALAQQQSATKMSSASISFANANIEMKKASQELAVTNNRLSLINNSLSGFDDITKSKIKQMLGIDNLGNAINEISSEQLQQARTGYSDEFSINPVLDEAFKQLEQGVRLSEQSDQLRLASVQGKAQIAQQLRDLYKRYSDFMRSLGDQIEDAKAKINKLSEQNYFASIQNDITRNSLGSTGNAKKLSEMFSSLISNISGIANEELSLVDEQRANSMSLRDLRIQYHELALEISPISDKFSQLSQSTDNLTNKFTDTANNIATQVSRSLAINFGNNISQSEINNGDSINPADINKVVEAHDKVDPRLNVLKDLRSSLISIRKDRVTLNKEHSNSMPKWADEIILGNINYDRYNGLQNQNDDFYSKEKELINQIDNLNKDIAENPWIKTDVSNSTAAIKEFNHQLDYNTPMATNSSIDALESYKNKIVELKTESKDIKFDKVVLDFQNQMLEFFSQLGDRSLALTRQMNDTSKSIRNLGEQFGALKIDPVSKAIREVNEAYDSQSRTIDDQELAVKREFGLGDKFKLSGHDTQDLANISSLINTDFSNSQLVTDLLEKVNGNEAAKSTILSLAQNLNDGVVSQDKFILELLQSFGDNRRQISTDREKSIDIQGSLASIQLENRRQDLFDSLKDNNSGFFQSRRFGIGQHGLWGDNKTTELKLEKELRDILKEKRDLINQINEAYSNSDITLLERDKLIQDVETLSKEKAEFAKVTNNPWLEQAKEGVISLKDSLISAINEGENVWESMGLAALEILGNIAQQAALTSLSTMNNGQGGSGFWGQLAGALISSLSTGYDGSYVPNYSDGKYNNAITLGLGVQKALIKEGHPKAFPAVINADEVVLSARGGSRSDASLWKRAKASGAWDAFKQNYNSNMAETRIDNYMDGNTSSDGTIATIAHNQHNNKSSNITNNYHYNERYSNSDRSNRETTRQKIRREKIERQRTQKN